MSTGLWYKVYDDKGEYVATCRWSLDAARLLGPGGKVKWAGRVVFTYNERAGYASTEQIAKAIRDTCERHDDQRRAALRARTTCSTTGQE